MKRDRRQIDEALVNSFANQRSQSRLLLQNASLKDANLVFAAAEQASRLTRVQLPVKRGDAYRSTPESWRFGF
jgi:hypothetical protein